jgi:hypothetical protein
VRSEWALTRCSGLEGAGVEIIDTTEMKSVENFESPGKTVEIFDKLSWKPWAESIPAGSFECGTS